MIADSLGHNDTSTVLTYLATDGDTMRQCALSLKGIEVGRDAVMSKKYVYRSSLAPYIEGLICQKRADGFLYEFEAYFHCGHHAARKKWLSCVA